MKLYKNLETALKEREEVLALKVSLTEEGFPPELYMLPNLQELYLEGKVTDFPKIGHVWVKLKILSVRWPDFNGSLAGLFTLPSLENLKIIETPLKPLRLPLGQVNAPLKSLTLKSCGLVELPEEISMLTRIQDFNLSGNELTSLPVSFPLLEELKRLNLDQNRFARYPEPITSMKKLAHLSIDGNLFPEEEKARIQRQYNLLVH